MPASADYQKQNAEKSTSIYTFFQKTDIFHLILFFKSIYKLNMDQFFEQGQASTIPQTNANQSQYRPQFSEDINMQPSFNNQNNSQHQQFGQFQQNEQMKRMREEEERIHEKLRQKSQQQYEQKEKRKQQGRTQLESFLQQKQREKEQRKQQNIKKQQQLKQLNLKMQSGSSWFKVAANVGLKQGEYPGTKDVNRMRQSIINKKNDQI